MPKKIQLYELQRNVYGRLTVIGDNGVVNNARRLQVKCICGTEKSVMMSHLLNGKTVSCGCKKRENVIKRNTTHGLSKHPLYRIWKAINERCYDKKHISYQWYGLKGVTVCKEWRYNFKSFYEWAIANGYKKGLKIDRIKNKLGYSPNNCKWSTDLESARNMSTNRLFTMNGERKCVSEWCEIFGIERYVVSDRLNKLGWSFKKAILTLVRPLNVN